MDVPMPASPADAGRTPGAPWRIWVEERRRLVIATAFVAAVLLGVLIGLVTAPNGPAPKASTADVPASARSPQLAADWNASRNPGTALNIKLKGDTPTVLRQALTWASADYALARAGKPSWSSVYLASSSASAAGSAGGSSLTDKSLTIPQGHLYYGVLEGSSAAADVYWAVGEVETAGANSPVPVSALQVWNRVGSGAWTVVQVSQGACAAVPQAMITAWGTPADCSLLGAASPVR